MKYNEKPEGFVMHYSITVVDAHIISPIGNPHIIRDYVLTCLVSEERTKELIKTYSEEIRLTRQEVERLKKTQGELERELSQLCPIALESILQKLEIERKLNTIRPES